MSNAFEQEKEVVGTINSAIHQVEEEPSLDFRKHPIAYSISSQYLKESEWFAIVAKRSEEGSRNNRVFYILSLCFSSWWLCLKQFCVCWVCLGVATFIATYLSWLCLLLYCYMVLHLWCYMNGWLSGHSLQMILLNKKLFTCLSLIVCCMCCQ